MLRFLTAGESHGPCLMAIIEGLPAGLQVDVEQINQHLARRQRGYGRGHRMNIEQDRVELLAGVLYGKTTGAPLALRIENKDWKNWSERWASGDLPRLTVPRPGHADYAGMVKYGLEDARLVLERASARETTARVAVGAVARQLLAAFGVELGSYVEQIGDVRADLSDPSDDTLEAVERRRWELAEASDVRCPDPDAAERMRAAVDAARRSKDSLGGVFVVSACGVPVGLGSHVHWDRRLDARLALAMMSIPAVKGVEIGEAFANAGLPGTRVHDDLYPDGKGGVLRRTNRAGGTEGGMSNGAPLRVRAAIKPIPTTGTPHCSVDLLSGEAAEPQYQRSDICVVPAAAVVGEAMLAWTLAEALVEKLGGDSLQEMMR
ncbi:MAG: chorismate synthase [Anaerolineae bacterium]|nr:chorismate synthase [Anaerolineae bacterium]